MIVNEIYGNDFKNFFKYAKEIKELPPIPKNFDIKHLQDFINEFENLQQENARLKDKIEKFEEWLKYKAEALDTFDIPKRKETGAFWFSTRGEIDSLLELLKEN